MLIEKLPEIAAAIASPLGKIDRITMGNNGATNSTGIDKITKGVMNVIGQVPGVVNLRTSSKRSWH
jgi:flotillin